MLDSRLPPGRPAGLDRRQKDGMGRSDDTRLNFFPHVRRTESTSGSGGYVRSPVLPPKNPNGVRSQRVGFRDLEPVQKFAAWPQ